MRRSDDYRWVQGGTSDLLCRIIDVARFCRGHAQEIGRLQDLSNEIGLAQETADAISSALADPSAIRVSHAIDYDLALLQLAAGQLHTELLDVRVTATRRLQMQVGDLMLGPFQPQEESLLAQQESGPGQQELAASTLIAPSAGRLLTVASRLLPSSERARYAEEYECELWELASAGAGKAEQFRYATRQALRVGHLRGEVLAPRSKSAAP
ncbi:MAG: hypothetical protein ACLQFR_15190 [Streptosporangiaceae bacterium]